MKANRPDCRLPPLQLTADEFGRLAAVADRVGVDMALYAKRAVMRAVARQEAAAGSSGEARAAALRATNAESAARRRRIKQLEADLERMEAVLLYRGPDRFGLLNAFGRVMRAERDIERLPPDHPERRARISLLDRDKAWIARRLETEGAGGSP